MPDDTEPADAPPSGFERSGIQKISYEFHLKLFMAALFLPEGLSVVVGGVRLPIVRILTIVYIVSFVPSERSIGSIRFPSDIIVLVAGAWMILAGTVTSGVLVGLKSAGATTIDFVGAYYIFRNMANAPDVSVNVFRFTAKVMVVVAALAMLDPLSGRLFVHDLAGQITGYQVVYSVEEESFFRNGLVRAMGPMEHSILFGAACGWVAVLTLCMTGIRLFSVLVVLAMLTGIWFSQSRASLAVCLVGLGLTLFYFHTKRFAWRWKFVGFLMGCVVLVVCVGSRNPFATFLNFGGVDSRAGWYRLAIWETAGPLVLANPVFGIGLFSDWDWQSSGVLVGGSVDALWLEAAMVTGIPGSLLIFLTMASPFWHGPVDLSKNLTEGEQRLSVALGIVTFMSAFLAFVVHLWGADWILIAVFAGTRANLMESARMRSGVGHEDDG